MDEFALNKNLKHSLQAAEFKGFQKILNHTAGANPCEGCLSTDFKDAVSEWGESVVFIIENQRDSNPHFDQTFITENNYSGALDIRHGSLIFKLVGCVT